MKLITVTGPVESFDRVVETYIAGGGMHIENIFDILPNAPHIRPFNDVNPYTPLLNMARELANTLDIPLEYRDFSSVNLDADAVHAYFSDLSSRIRAAAAERDALKRTIEDDRQVLSQLSHLLQLDLNVTPFFHMTFAKFRFGRMLRDTYTLYYSQIEQHADALFIPTSFEGSYIYGFYLTPLRHEEAVDTFFASLHFERIRLSEKAHGTPAEAQQQITLEADELSRRFEAVSRELADLRADEAEQFLTAYSYAKFYSDTFDIRRYAARSRHAFYLCGWVPDSRAERFAQNIERGVEGVSITAEPPNTAETDLSPPIKLKNFILFRPFQSLIQTYGLPAYNEIDPTSFMAISYALLFGTMFGDIGQGLLLTIGGLLLGWRKKMKLALVIAEVGLFSAAFGFIYGSVFGNEDILPGFRLLGHPANVNTMLLLTVGLGIALMSLAMIYNIINGIRQRDLHKTVFSPHGLAGIVLYWGILAAALSVAGMIKEKMLPGWLLPVCVLLPLSLIFFGGPLSRLIRRDKEWMPKNKMEFALVSFFELFELFISMLSNTVSFVRVGAMALSHAGMMLVVRILADSMGNAGIAVMILGNLLVMGLEGLIVGIQCMRLEFYEIFGKFYSGTGRPYQPFTVNYSLDN